MATEKRMKNCDNCTYSGRPSYDYPCTSCTSAYGSAPSKWEIMRIEGADLVEVVRCKDCKYCDPENHHCDHYTATILPLPRKLDGFCSYGERKDNE